MSRLPERSDRTSKRYDLLERLTQFAEEVIRYLRQLPNNPITDPLIRQLVRSATSIGANFTEADNASSQRDFRHKVGISRKEADETKYWLRMVATAVPDMAPQARILWTEARELHLILVSIFKKQSRLLAQAKLKPAETAPASTSTPEDKHS